MSQQFLYEQLDGVKKVGMKFPEIPKITSSSLLRFVPSWFEKTLNIYQYFSFFFKPIWRETEIKLWRLFMDGRPLSR